MNRRTVSGILVMLLLQSMLMLTSDIQPARAEPEKWTVDDDGPADFHTIQEAIDGASPGDVIYVYNGTYSEHLEINKSLTLEGESNQNTFIRSQKGSCNYAFGVHVRASNVTISGFKITSDTAPLMPLAIDARTIYPCSNNTIQGNILINNGTDCLVLVHSSNNRILDNSIICDPEGVGVGGLKSSFNVIDNNTITGGWAGICLLQESSNNTITNNLITEQASSPSDGGGITIHDQTNASITGNTLVRNDVGIHFLRSSGNTIYHNNLIGNTLQVYDYSWEAPINDPSVNTWDDGYPSGGNYWSNYTGEDSYSGPDQNETGSDGIGDTPHTIYEDNQDRYPLMQAFDFLINLAVVNVVPSETTVYEGDVVNINVTVENEGTLPEVFNVTTYYDNNTVQMQTDVYLDPDTKTVLEFNWNTSGVSGNHIISAEASIALGENYTSDNTFINGIVEVLTRIDEPINGENATIEGNVTITNVLAKKNKLSMDASGPSGSTGWINVTFPMVNTTTIKVFLNNTKLTPPPFPIITANETHYFIYFEFNLSAHEITIQYAVVDLAITNTTLSTTVVGEACPLNISITVQNQGEGEETFNVTAFYNETAMILSTGKNYTTVTLSSGNSKVIICTWNNTGVPRGNYTVSAYAVPTPFETDTDDNMYSDGSVLVTVAGDVNGDGIVNIYDLNIAGRAYGSWLGEPRYSSEADITGDGHVDMRDIMVIGRNYGKINS